ncbi:hypothetical protein EX895_002728 [Sporisorium graminicola]|uniref:JmjC domain-containing protein n=1 Tax=Sporisorium graminicola TaxID=280036 RepID=A0A4U7KVZ7_9BASI|nr:hypothetical protein EX895_002728 [Sporisorium graminicola]TKY88376.1 hypothetical protein EX895_002728 [Sporisorium graminicola]
MTKTEQTHHGDVELMERTLGQLSQSQGTPSTQSTGAAALIAQRQIRNIARCLSTSSQGDQSSFDDTNAQLSALTRLCDQKFVAFSYNSIPLVWRAIYIDVQLLRACCALKAVGDVEHAAKARCCIRDLDLALIVAGAASTSKGQYCHNLIAALQSKLLELGEQDHHRALQGSDQSSPPRKRFKVTQPEHRKAPLSDSIQADSLIQEYTFEEAPSFMEVAARGSSSRGKPFIVRTYAQNSGWPAVPSESINSGSSSWSSIEHLLRIAGPARIVPVEVGANYSRKDWGQDLMLWSEFLSYCRWTEADQCGSTSDVQVRLEPGSARPVLYMAQHDLAAQFPALERDYMLPDYVYTSPSPTESWPGYQPPATHDGVVTNLWIGPAGTVSPPHYDPFYNCFVQAVGYKEVWVAPPHCCPRRKPAPSDHIFTKGALHAGSGETSSLEDADAKGSITDSLMVNTASIDVFDTVESVPPFVRLEAAKAILGPGDLLYLPPGWWHSLRSLTRSFSVSTWF